VQHSLSLFSFSRGRLHAEKSQGDKVDKFAKCLAQKKVIVLGLPLRYTLPYIEEFVLRTWCLPCIGSLITIGE
jgi:hypothetical protein